MRVKRHLVALEQHMHRRLEPFRLRGLHRANANEWFRFDDAILRILFDDGWIVARARVAGRPLGTRFGRNRWASPQGQARRPDLFLACADAIEPDVIP